MADLARLRDWKQIAATTRQLGRYDARSRVICYTAADAIEEMVAELKQLQDDNATLKTAQKACEHCDSCIAAVVEERAREIAEAMPSGMLEMSNADYWTTQINAAITLAVQQERDRCMAECEQLRRDAERLDWLMRNVSGAEFRRLGVNYGGNCGRDRIDAAIDAASAEGER